MSAIDMWEVARREYSYRNFETMQNTLRIEKRHLPEFMKEVCKEESEETDMKLTGFNKVAAITQGYGGTYYYALYDETIEVGDKVLVSGTAEGKLHTVDEIISAEEAANRFSKDITAEVICRVDMSAYDKRVIDRKEAKKIKDEMNRIIKQMDEVNKYEMYAKNNPELDAMLRKYKNLVG